MASILLGNWTVNITKKQKKSKVMRLFLNTSIFVSVIQTEKGFDCQIMELVNGYGMYPATIMDNQRDVVSCIVHKGFRETAKICKDLQELADYHLQCLIDLEQYNNSELNKLESQSYEG